MKNKTSTLFSKQNTGMPMKTFSMHSFLLPRERSSLELLYHDTVSAGLIVQYSDSIRTVLSDTRQNKNTSKILKQKLLIYTTVLP